MAASRRHAARRSRGRMARSCSGGVDQRGCQYEMPLRGARAHSSCVIHPRMPRSVSINADVGPRAKSAQTDETTCEIGRAWGADRDVTPNEFSSRPSGHHWPTKVGPLKVGPMKAGATAVPICMVQRTARFPHPLARRLIDWHPLLLVPHLIVAYLALMLRKIPINALFRDHNLRLPALITAS